MRKYFEWMVNRHPVVVAFWLMSVSANVVCITFRAELHWLNALTLGMVIGTLIASVQHYKAIKS